MPPSKNVFIYSHTDMTPERLQSFGMQPMECAPRFQLTLKAGEVFELEPYEWNYRDGDLDEVGKTVLYRPEHMWEGINRHFGCWGIVRCKGPVATAAEKAEAQTIYERYRYNRVHEYILARIERLHGGHGPIIPDPMTRHMMEEMNMDEEVAVKIKMAESPTPPSLQASEIAAIVSATVQNLPQPQGLTPADIAAIVAATVQAMRQSSPETESAPPTKRGPGRPPKEELVGA